MMKKVLLLSTVVLMISGAVFSQNVIDKIGTKAKLDEGKRQLYSYNYKGALKTFKEILALDAENPKANYFTAECYYALNNYDLAKKYAEKSHNLDAEVNPEIHYLLGKIYHRLEDLDKAKEEYAKFKEEKKSMAEKKYDIDITIAQVEYAIENKNVKKDVKIENLGDAINSENPDYSASVSADGKTLIFTSRRSDTKGGAVDVNFDHQYFEDIYISTWNDETGEWSQADNSSLGKLNSEGYDASLSISSDGEEIYIYKNTNKTGSGDIYFSKMNKKGNWGTPKSIDESKNVNSSYFESSASMTADGKTIYFVSDRPGGEGMADIYMATRDGKSFSKPVNLGPVINTSLDEKFVTVHPSGNALFFSSNGRKDSYGGYDIYVSYKVKGQWTEPVNLGAPINTVNEEKTFAITEDGKTAFISAFYPNGKGDSDIYKIDLSNLDILAAPEASTEK